MLNIAAGAPASTAYNLTRSLRFRASASAYLNRTPAGAGNRKTWTWSGWIKRGALGGDYGIFSAGLNSSFNIDAIEFNSSNQLRLYSYDGSYIFHYITTQVFRDPSAWYHIIVAVDTTQATASNRVKVYVNNVQVTSFGTQIDPSLNVDCAYFNNTNAHAIGATFTNSRYFDGYLAETNFVNAAQLTPASFGSTNALTGVWQPAPYTGTYGTNGFYLKFTSNSTAAALGTDFSGNSNTWTVNNISLTAGVTYDSMTDVPTLTNATTANYAVLNPLDSAASVLTNGNLQFTSAGNAMSRASIAMPSGKWYAEVTFTSGSQANIGIATSTANLASYLGSDAFGWGYAASGVKINNNTTAAYGASFTTNDVIGITFDTSNGQLTFYKNNVSQGVAYTVATTGTYFFALGTGSCGNAINFGQRPFAFSPPTGFLALNAFNLPTASILKGNTVMDATLYTGNGSTLAVTNAAGFKPDLVWIKQRNTVRDNQLQDSVRGVSLSLQSNTTSAEGNYSLVSSLNSNGFTVFTNGTYLASNENGGTYVGWQWQAGQGVTSSNTSGSITSTVSVNPTAGFSVVTFTGNGTAGATVGHGLGVAPSLIITKSRQYSGQSWFVYHRSITANNYLVLNTTDASTASILAWNNTAPTSSVMTLGAANGTNFPSGTQVSYCWSEIDGFSKFGSYVGNSNADGPFIYCGFRPKFVLFKGSSFSNNWYIIDSSTNTINVAGAGLIPNASTAETATSTTENAVDFLSNGFKLRNNAASVAFNNASGQTFIYAAFAESPFKNSLAR